MPAAPPAPVRTAPERLLLRLEWRVLRRLEGRVAGGYRTAHRGTGTDLAGLRAYLEGDDARHIDWNVTARLNEPQLRVFNEDRELTVWLVLDRSASMTVGVPGRGKQDVLSELAVVLARMFSRGGNQVGALLYDNGAVRTVPPGTGRRHVLHVAAELSRVGPGGGDRAKRLERESKHAPRSGGRSDGSAGSAAATAARPISRPCSTRSPSWPGGGALIIVISDFIGDGDWERSLLRLGPRHEVVALRVVDAADDELPDAGLVVVEDAETGEQLIVDSGDPLLRARLRAAVEERDASTRRGNAPGRRARAPHRHDGGPGHRARRGRGEHQAQAPMTFANPVLLAVGLLVAAALAWAAVAAARRRAAALAAAGVASAGGRRGRLAGVWFTIAGIAVLAIATAGPAATVPVSHASGTVILAMDVSGSMAATDVPPSRLSAAKKAAQAFINAQPASVDIGVVAFEQGGLEAAIPSADHATALAAIGRLSPGGGTSLGSAILAALSAITHRTVAIGPNGSAPDIGFWPSATIVLFSDGQDGGAGTRRRHPAAAPARRGRHRR